MMGGRLSKLSCCCCPKKSGSGDADEEPPPPPPQPDQRPETEPPRAVPDGDGGHSTESVVDGGGGQPSLSGRDARVRRSFGEHLHRLTSGIRASLRRSSRRSSRPSVSSNANAVVTNAEETEDQDASAVAVFNPGPLAFSRGYFTVLTFTQRAHRRSEGFSCLRFIGHVLDGPIFHIQLHQ